MNINDEREEGELLSDEELEDVSDTSSVSVISLATTTGKSTSSRNSRLTREPFRELSLTSVSDEPYSRPSRETKHRGECRRRRCSHEERSSKRTRKLSPIRRVVITNQNRHVRPFTRELSNVSSSSNNSDDYRRNRKLFKQLRDAVTINSSSKKLPNCSLRTRLKRMIEPDIQDSNKNISDADEDLELEALRDQALQSKLLFKKAPTPPSTTVIDPDLMQLRIVALKSTVLKRHHIRQRLKEGQLIQKDLGEQNNIPALSEKQKSIESKEGAVDLENIHYSCEVEKKFDNKVENIEIIAEKQNVPSPLEEKTEITVDKQINVENKDDNLNDKRRVSETIDDDEDILRAMLLTSISRNIENKKSNNFNLPKNAVLKKRPENNNNTEKVLKHPIPVVNRIIINVNSDSDSDELFPDSGKQSSEKTEGPKREMFDKNLAIFLQQARAKTEAKHHQSDISRLPRQQQLEYRKLKKKLNLLTSQLKPTSVSKVIKTNSVCLDENERSIKNKYVVANNNKITSNLLSSGLHLKPKSTQGQRIKQPVKEKEERLQMKGKYEDLAPLMAEISDALKAREKAQSLVKKLITELDFARNELTTSHQTYTGLVQQLMKSKESIDKRLEDRLQKIKTKKVSTSTPLKQTPNEIPCELSNGSIEAQELPILPKVASRTEEEIQNVSKRKKDEEVRIEATAEVVSEKMGELVEDTKVIEMNKADLLRTAEEMEKELINNTIGKESRFLKYSSPLDHMQIHREQPVADPLQELCPYDLLGVCRDADCPYQHFGHAITE